MAGATTIEPSNLTHTEGDLELWHPVLDDFQMGVEAVNDGHFHECSLERRDLIAWCNIFQQSIDAISFCNQLGTCGLELVHFRGDNLCFGRKIGEHLTG